MIPLHRILVAIDAVNLKSERNIKLYGCEELSLRFTPSTLLGDTPDFSIDTPMCSGADWLETSHSDYATIIAMK